MTDYKNKLCLGIADEKVNVVGPKFKMYANFLKDCSTSIATNY